MQLVSNRVRGGPEEVGDLTVAQAPRDQARDLDLATGERFDRDRLRRPRIRRGRRHAHCRLREANGGEERDESLAVADSKRADAPISAERDRSGRLPAKSDLADDLVRDPLRPHDVGVEGEIASLAERIDLCVEVGALGLQSEVPLAHPGQIATGIREELAMQIEERLLVYGDRRRGRIGAQEEDSAVMREDRCEATDEPAEQLPLATARLRDSRELCQERAPVHPHVPRSDTPGYHGYRGPVEMDWGEIEAAEVVARRRCERLPEWAPAPRIRVRLCRGHLMDNVPKDPRDRCPECGMLEIDHDPATEGFRYYVRRKCPRFTEQPTEPGRAPFG